jgi:hypothetical protein
LIFIEARDSPTELKNSRNCLAQAMGSTSHTGPAAYEFRAPIFMNVGFDEIDRNSAAVGEAEDGRIDIGALALRASVVDRATQDMVVADRLA